MMKVVDAFDKSSERESLIVAHMCRALEVRTWMHAVHAWGRFGGEQCTVVQNPRGPVSLLVPSHVWTPGIILPHSRKFLGTH